MIVPKLPFLFIIFRFQENILQILFILFKREVVKKNITHLFHLIIFLLQKYAKFHGWCQPIKTLFVRNYKTVYKNCLMLNIRPYINFRFNYYFSFPNIPLINIINHIKI